MTRVLVARLDSVGDVLLAGPAVRAVANGRRTDGGAPNDVVHAVRPAGRSGGIPAAGRRGGLHLGLPVDHEPRPGGDTAAPRTGWSTTSAIPGSPRR